MRLGWASGDKERQVVRRNNYLRVQFSLCQALLLITVVALILCWYRQKECVRQELISEVELLGGNVKFENSGWLPSFPGTRVTNVTLPHAKTATFTLERLRLFPSLTSLHLTNCEFDCDGGGRLTTSQLNIDVGKCDTSLNDLQRR